MTVGITYPQMESRPLLILAGVKLFASAHTPPPRHRRRSHRRTQRSDRILTLWLPLGALRLPPRPHYSDHNSAASDKGYFDSVTLLLSNSAVNSNKSYVRTQKLAVW